MTDTGYIVLVIMVSLSFIIPILVFFAWKGIKLCENRNALGLIVLFLILNIFGLIWGICIILNAIEKQRNEEHRAILEVLNKTKNNES